MLGNDASLSAFIVILLYIIPITFYIAAYITINISKFINRKFLRGNFIYWSQDKISRSLFAKFIFILPPLIPFYILFNRINIVNFNVQSSEKDKNSYKFIGNSERIKYERIKSNYDGPSIKKILVSYIGLTIVYYYVYLIYMTLTKVTT